MLPTFLICGTQKGGTTSLFHYIKEHPEIWMVKKKELHFFDLNYNKGIDWYKHHFNKSRDKKIKAIGESTPSYMYIKEVPKRIKVMLPNVKLIFILRNPVDRAYSQYRFEIMRGYENLSFKEAIKKEEERLSRNMLFNRYHHSYKDRGKYVFQLQRYRKYFPEDQVLILINEELNEYVNDVLKKIFIFLGVDPNFLSSNWYIKYNKGKKPRFIIQSLQDLKRKLPHSTFGKAIRKSIDIFNSEENYPPMDQEIREELLDYFKKYNQELEIFLGRKINKWDA